MFYSISSQKEYCVCSEKNSSMEEVVEILARGLKNLRMEMPRIIVFCKHYDECLRMYCLFKYYLRHLFTEPPGAPNLPKFRGCERGNCWILLQLPVLGKSFCGVHRLTLSHLFSKRDGEAFLRTCVLYRRWSSMGIRANDGILPSYWHMQKEKPYTDFDNFSALQWPCKPCLCWMCACRVVHVSYVVVIITTWKKCSFVYLKYNFV